MYGTQQAPPNDARFYIIARRTVLSPKLQRPLRLKSSSTPQISISNLKLRMGKPHLSHSYLDPAFVVRDQVRVGIALSVCFV